MKPANCGFRVRWSPLFRERFEGQPLKNVALHFGDRSARGDVVITRDGLEGGALYALSAPLRDAIRSAGEAMLHIDLRTDLTSVDITARLARRPAKQSLSTALRKLLRLPHAAVGLVQEALHAASDRAGPPTADHLGRLLKALPVRLSGTASIDRAISTAGGLAFEALDASFMIRSLPGTFVAGEMLDWEAPTGGHLLQACFATGAAAGQGAAAWLASR